MEIVSFINPINASETFCRLQTVRNQNMPNKMSDLMVLQKDLFFENVNFNKTRLTDK